MEKKIFRKLWLPKWKNLGVITVWSTKYHYRMLKVTDAHYLVYILLYIWFIIWFSITFLKKNFKVCMRHSDSLEIRYLNIFILFGLLQLLTWTFKLPPDTRRIVSDNSAFLWFKCINIYKGAPNTIISWWELPTPSLGEQ